MCKKIKNKKFRFVQFGADQDCHCGSLHCKEKLGSMVPSFIFYLDELITIQ